MPSLRDYLNSLYELSYVIKGFNGSVKAGRKGQEVLMIPVLPRNMKPEQQQPGLLQDTGDLAQMGRKFEGYFSKISHDKTTFRTTTADWVNVSLPFDYYFPALPETVSVRHATLVHYLLARRLCLDPQGNVLVPNGKRGIHKFGLTNGRLTRMADEVPDRPDNPNYVAVAQHPDGHLMAVSDRGIYYRKPAQGGSPAREYTFKTDRVGTDVFLQQDNNTFYVSLGEHGAKGCSHSSANSYCYENLDDIPSVSACWFNGFLYLVDGTNLRCANLNDDERSRDGVSTIPIGNNVHRVCVLNGFLFATSSAGVHAFNVGRPQGADRQHPPRVGVIPLPGGDEPTALTAFGDVLLVGTKAGKILALDTNRLAGSGGASPAQSLQTVLTSTSRGVVLDLLVSGNRIYSLELGTGLRMLVLGQKLAVTANTVVAVPFVSDRTNGSWFQTLADAERFYFAAFHGPSANMENAVFLSPEIRNLYCAEAMTKAEAWLKNKEARLKYPGNYSAVVFFVGGPSGTTAHARKEKALKFVDPVWGIDAHATSEQLSVFVRPGAAELGTLIHEVGHHIVPKRPEVVPGATAGITHPDYDGVEANGSGEFDIMGRNDLLNGRPRSFLGAHLVGLDFVDSTIRIDERRSRPRTYYLTQKEPWKNTRPFPSANLIHILDGNHFIELRAPQLPPPALGGDPIPFETYVPEEMSPSRIGVVISRNFPSPPYGIQLHSEGDRNGRNEPMPIILVPGAVDPARPWIRSSVVVPQIRRRITAVSEVARNPWVYEICIEDV